MIEDGRFGKSPDKSTMDETTYFWQGKLTRLRPVQPDDAESAYRGAFDSPARQVLQLGIELPRSVEEWRETLSRYAECRDVDGVILFTIEDLDGHDVGGISYHTRDRKNGAFSFGIRVPASHRRRGYAADATRVLLRYGFLERRYHKCNSACVAGNTASAALHRTLGFVEEGRRRQTLYFNGRYHDELLFGLTHEEFDANDAPFRPAWIT
jgi:RimJ/RimL family protein N-acetyltransferase